MKNLTVKIQEAYDAFVKDAALQAEKGNKSAGTRARKASLAVEKMMSSVNSLWKRPGSRDLSVILTR